MNLRIAALAAIPLAAIMLLAGCSKATSNANSTNTTNSHTGPSSSPIVTDTAQPTPTATSTTTGTSSASTPTEAFQAYYEAIKRKDVDAVKNLFSKGTLSMMETQAKQTNKSLDDVLKEGLEEASKEIPDTLPESRNEKIDGDTATLEVRDDKKDKWETVHFVKENGDWKVAFEK